MFVVDEATAQAIRQAVEDGGEVAGVAELRRHYRLMEGNPAALQCVRVIAGWKPPGERGRPAGTWMLLSPRTPMPGVDLSKLY